MPLKFTYICNLLDDLDDLETREVPLPNREKANRQADKIRIWFKNHRRLLEDSDTNGAAVLSTFLPEQRKDRGYGIQRDKLATAVSRALCFGSTRAAKLMGWRTCRTDFATLVSQAAQESEAGSSFRPINVEEVDAALDELATLGPSSGPAYRSQPRKSTRTRQTILEPIIRKLRSSELKWFIRLLLKDLRPVVIHEVLLMSCFHPLLPAIWKIQHNFEAAINVLNDPVMKTYKPGMSQDSDSKTRKALMQSIKPTVGVKIGRPNYFKARGIKDCLRLVGNGSWNVETKYDGEYCQIHIDLNKGEDCVRLFSKSGRDSTRDRIAVHASICQALRIGRPDCRFKSSCILEGEMVVFDSRSDEILEFHKIRNHVHHPGISINLAEFSPKKPYESIGIVYYDALMVDDDDLMFKSYEQRRKVLKELVEYDHAKARRASWGTIQFATSGMRAEQAEKQLLRAFSKSITHRCEGLVLKPSEGAYISTGAMEPGKNDGIFIKLKRDYIPGMGDSADFALVGANHNSSVSHGLHDKVLWNEFLIACLINKEDVARYDAIPVFRFMGTISHGFISKKNIQFVCLLGKLLTRKHNEACPPIKYKFETNNTDHDSFDMFSQPLVVDVLGSAFEKSPESGAYMLRHPRITKVHVDRHAEDVISFDELQEYAMNAKLSPTNLAEEEQAWIRRLWKANDPHNKCKGTTPSPGNFTSTTSSQRTTPKSTSSWSQPQQSPNEKRALPPGSSMPGTKPGNSTIKDFQAVVHEVSRKRPLQESPSTQSFTRREKRSRVSESSNSLHSSDGGIGEDLPRTPVFVRADSLELQPDEDRFVPAELPASNGKFSKHPYPEESRQPSCKHAQTIPTSNANHNSSKQRLSASTRVKGLGPSCRQSQTFSTSLRACDAVARSKSDRTSNNHSLRIFKLDSRHENHCTSTPRAQTAPASHIGDNLGPEKFPNGLKLSHSRREGSKKRTRFSPSPEKPLKKRRFEDRRNDSILQVQKLAGRVGERSGVPRLTEQDIARFAEMANTLDDLALESLRGNVFDEMFETDPKTSEGTAKAASDETPHKGQNKKGKTPEPNFRTAQDWNHRLQSRPWSWSTSKTRGVSHEVAHEQMLAGYAVARTSDTEQDARRAEQQSPGTRLSGYSSRPPHFPGPFWPKMSGEAYALPFESPFEDRHFYLAPTVARTGFFLKNILPLFAEHGNYTENLDHWRREVDPDADPLGPVVPESQAYPNYKKTVLVDSFEHQETNETLEQIKSLKLNRGEKIQIWDWRMLEGLAHITEGSDGLVVPSVETVIRNIEQACVAEVEWCESTSRGHVGMVFKMADLQIRGQTADDIFKRVNNGRYKV